LANGQHLRKQQKPPRKKVRAANAARNLAVHRKATQADADLQWFEAKASVDDIDAENTRVMARNRLLK
jgi:hypothetical protein